MSPLLLHGNTNQYILMVYFVLPPRCFAYRHATTTFYQLQRGFGDRRQHERIQGFLSVLFSPLLILQFTEGDPMVLLLRKLYLYFTKDPEGVHYFQGGGGCQTFSGGGGGPNANFFRNPCTYLLCSRGHVGTPYPIWIRTWAMSS